MEKIVPVNNSTRATLGVSLFAKGKDWQFYGDNARVSAFLEISIFGSSNSGGSFSQVGRTRIVSYRARKLQNVSFKLGNASAFNRLKLVIKCKATSKHTTKDITTGAFVVEDVQFRGMTGNAGNGSAPRTKPLVELTQDGLFLFSNKDSFMRLDSEGFSIKGDIDATEITAGGDVTVSGSLRTMGAVELSGSLLVEKDVAIGFGTNEPEAKVMVREEFSSDDLFFEGASGTPVAPYSLHNGASLPVKVAAAVKGGFKALSTYVNNGSNVDYGRSWYQSAFFAEPIKGTYGVQNTILHGTLITGESDSYGGGVPSSLDNNTGLTMDDFEMTSSVSVGWQSSHHGRKKQYGMRIHQEYGRNATSFAQCWLKGIEVYHGSATTGAVSIDTTVKDSDKKFEQQGFIYYREGKFSNCSDSNTDPGFDAGVYIENAATSTSGTSYGEVGGYGIYVKGSQWKSYFQNKVGIGVTVPTVALDVSGEIKATGNITAFSDVRHKTNINTITNAIEIVNDLRGVRFNWNDEYKENHNEHNEFSTSGRIDNVQIGLIAQEVEEVLPELVSTDTDGFKNVNYQNMVAVLIEANKEQQKLIEDLQERVKKLESS